MKSDLELKSYDYNLPAKLIANAPASPKGSEKMLVYYRATGEIRHLKFSDLCDILPECAIILNDTKVIKARIYGHKDSGGKIELLLNQPLNDGVFSVYIKGKVKKGQILKFQNGLDACVCELFSDGSKAVKFSQNHKILKNNELFALLEKIGHVPLPPYIKRPDNENDEKWYQSIFAKAQGAVAAPTASLHFSPEILNKLQAKFQSAFITLHVGAGTFKGVECENILEHKMHSEFFELSNEAINLITSPQKLLAVGTTVARTIEYFVRTEQKSGFCDLFLHPQNPPKRLDYLLTNFHLPKSTLIMLVASLTSLDECKRIYQIAIEQKYRFYSYGDAMLIL